jgi:mRNA-degrading endonuclease RelE of RelBE toxin-antitoxin system
MTGPAGFSLVRNYNLDYTPFMRHVILSPAAVRHYRRLPAAARKLLKVTIHQRLALEDAAQENRNRFRLRRLSPHADFELRVESWRVFYRVQGDRVIVELIGRKSGSSLFIGGKEYKL